MLVLPVLAADAMADHSFHSDFDSSSIWPVQPNSALMIRRT